MEKINIPIENDEQVPEETEKVIDQVTDDESKKVIEQVTDDISKKIEETNKNNNNNEMQMIENKIQDDNIEKNDDEVVPSTTPKPIEEQENVNDINTNISNNNNNSMSPNRSNVPFKEVNESDKEENTIITNGTDNINNKKRELDNDDEGIQEKFLDNDERTNDQTKKIKITETNDNSSVETKESENNNIIVNSTTAVEV